MSKIITKIERKRGLDYHIDKSGNVIESNYNWLRDKTTLVVLVIIILGGLYYLQMSQSSTNEKNFDSYCTTYYELRNQFIMNNPDKEVNVENVLEYAEKKKQLNYTLLEDG